MNFSAPFIPQFFGEQVQKLMPYCDIIIGNESEGEAWANANGVPDPKDLRAVARAIALQPKANPSRPRTVILTCGADATVWVSAADPENPKEHPVSPLRDEEIVDTNGAGTGQFSCCYS